MIELRRMTERWWVFAAGASTLGSGIVNLVSAGSPNLPDRHEIIREIFPLEFLHVSRSLTLLAGFALVIASLQIVKRKRRAWQLVIVLAGLSVIFHLIKGLDYEESIFSAMLLGLLWLTRKQFTVRSSVPDFPGGFLRLALALVVALVYGVAGFWFLDRSQFGIDFRLGDAIHRTLLYLCMVGDSRLVPQRHFAAWFLDSLYLISSLAICYSVWSVFRPVLYQYRTLPNERIRAGEIIARHGRSSLDFFKAWQDKSFFFSDSGRSVLAYRVGANFALVLADPVGPEEEFEEIVQAFAGLCRENDWRVAFHQTLPDFLPVYHRLGFKKMKIGDEAVVDLARFSLDGKENKKIRHYLNQLDKSGVHARRVEPPVPEEILGRVKEVSDEWLQIPGRRERRFTLGQFETGYIRSTPLFLALDGDGRIQAFVNIIPSFCPGEATIDLMRYRPDAPAGIMDYLFVKLFQHCRELGFTRFSLGMAPLAGFQEKDNATVEERAVHFFLHRLNFLFSFSGLRQYKAKYAGLWEPRYSVYRTPLDLPLLALALEKVGEIEG